MVCRERGAGREAEGGAKGSGSVPGSSRVQARLPRSRQWRSFSLRCLHRPPNRNTLWPTTQAALPHRGLGGQPRVLGYW